MEGPAGSASAYGRDIKHHQTVAVSGIMVGRPKIGRYRANMLRLEESLGEKGFPLWSSDHFVVFLTGHR
jgi:hypothetical protein